MSTRAIRADDFTNSIGINTHLDFKVTAYNNISVVESALTYLGVKQVRDAMQFPTSPTLFAEVAAATGVKYDLFLAPSSEADLAGELRNLQQLPVGDIQLIEGRNEADGFGPGFQQGIADQVTLYRFVQQNLPGIPVIQESFVDLPDYGKAGDQSAFADYGNAHTYFGTGNNPALGNWIGVLNADALDVTQGKPVMITEAGYYTTGSTTDPNSVDVTVQAKYTLDLVFDSFQAGDVKTYLYELLDQKSGDGSPQDNFGLFYSDGAPKPAATAIRNLLTLLKDPGSSASSFPQGSMTYSLSGLPAGGNSFLMEKSDGSYWLAVWDDTRLSGPVTPTDIAVPPVPVSINLGFIANIQVFDPLTGTTVIKTADGVTNVTISLPDHPVLVEILPVSGSTTAPPVDPPPRDIIEPSFTVPGGETVAESRTIAVTGIQFNDSVAANAAGALSLNVSSNVGHVTMTGGAGKVLTGSGTTSIFVQGTLAQLNAELATLSYTAGANAGPDQLSVTVTDQSGNTFNVAVHVSVTTTGRGAPPPPSGPSITVPGTETVAAGQMLSVTGVQIVDSYAASHPGQLALNVSSSGGNIAMTDGNGTTLAGSGSTHIFVQGTLRQINADLATLSYTAGTTTSAGQISVEVYDQLGLSSDATLPVAITAASAPTGPTITGTSGNDNIVATVNNTTINAGAGNDNIFLSGTGDVVTTGNGTNTVMGFVGGNTITTGSGNDVIRISGTGSVVNAGLGDNTISDSGHGNTFVLPTTGGTDDIFG
jgi:serralysin